MTGIAEVIANEGLIPGGASSGSKSISPRKRGVKQGAFIFLLSFLVVPVLVLLSVAVNVRRPIVAILAAILLVAGAFLRIAYALLFESGEPGGKTLEENMAAASRNFLGRPPKHAELKPETSAPAAAYVAPGTGNWRDTNDLVPTASVTDNTTKLLTKNEERSVDQ